MENQSRLARLAVIGCGQHATQKLYPALARLGDTVDLVAACDLDAERAKRAARRFGARRYYNDTVAMLEAEDVDGVVVVGLPRMHYEVGLQVLRRGLPVFTEKPPAMTSALAVEMAKTAEEHGTFGMVAFMKRFAVGYRMAMELCSQPKFGGVQMLEVKFSQGPYPAIWGLESPAMSFLTGQVVHLMDLARFFGGDVVRVQANYREVAPEQFGYLVNVTFANGVIGTLNFNTLEARESWRDFEERLVLAGVEHQITVDDMLYLSHSAAEDWIAVPGLNIGRLRQTWKPTGPAFRPAEELIGFQGELAHFAACARDKVPASPSFWDGAAALQIGEAIWESARSGRAVELEPLR